MNMQTIEQKDTATFNGQTLKGTHYYQYSDNKSEDFHLEVCDATSPDCTYWAALGGKCYGFKVVSGETCIASVEQLLRDQRYIRYNESGWNNPDSVYVIWQLRNATQANWHRWQLKWSKRTALRPA